MSNYISSHSDNSETVALAEPAVREHEFTDQRRYRRLWLLWNERRLVFRASVIGVVAGVALAFLLPKHYDATTRILPPDPTMTNPTAAVAMAASRASLADTLSMKTPGALYVAILQSRSVQDRLIDHFDLRKIYGDRYYEDARRDLRRNSAITEERKSGVITVTVTDRDPNRAAAMAAEYVAAVNAVSRSLNTGTAHRQREFIEGRLAEIHQQLAQASEELSRFSARNGTVDISQQSKAMVESAAILKGQLIAAEAEKKGLEQIYTPENVRVRAAEARVNKLRTEVAAIGGRDPYENPAQEDNAEFPSIRKLPQLAVTYTELYRRARTLETVNEALTKQYEMAKIQEAGEMPGVQVLDASQAPEKKSTPHRALVVLLVWFFTTTCAVGWLFARERWNELGAEHPLRQLAAQVLASVSHTRVTES